LEDELLAGQFNLLPVAGNKKTQPTIFYDRYRDLCRTSIFVHVQKRRKM